MTNNYYDEFLLEVKQLIKENRYYEVQKKLKLELEMPYIPKGYENRIVELYEEVNKLIKLNSDTEIKQWDLDTIKKVIMSPFDEEIHLVAFHHLVNQNARKILPEIKRYLLNEQFRNENKTHLLLVLKDQELNEQLQVNKTHGRYLINPSEITHFEDEKLTRKIHKILDNKVYNDSPSLMQICWSIWENYWYNFYPFLEDLEYYNDLSAAITYCAHQLQFETISIKQISEKFNSSFKNTEKIIKKIYKYEVL